MDLKIPEIAHIPYPRRLRGNRSRRHHVGLPHELRDLNELEGTNVDELSSLRLQSQRTAERFYDSRSKALRAARASRALLASADKHFGLQEPAASEEKPTEQEPAENAERKGGDGHSRREPAEEEAISAREEEETFDDGQDLDDEDANEVLLRLPARKRQAIYSSSEDEAEEPLDHLHTTAAGGIRRCHRRPGPATAVAGSMGDVGGGTAPHRLPAGPT